LWDIYSERDVYYSRFEPKIKKHNFANVFMNIAGINIEAKNKLNNFPQIKNKIATQQSKNNGSLIFDSHF
jgi:Fe-S-cluster containining protein